jgi:hypothetical protein
MSPSKMFFVRIWLSESLALYGSMDVGSPMPRRKVACFAFPGVVVAPALTSF